MADTKTEKVLQHLKTQGTLTSIEAIELYGATRLAAIIHTLRKQGYNIITHDESGMTRYGDMQNYARYELVNGSSNITEQEIKEEPKPIQEPKKTTQRRKNDSSGFIEYKFD